MKNYLIVLLAIISLLFTTCQNELISTDDELNSITYVNCIDVPCHSPNTLNKSLSSDDYLHGYSYTNDTLRIDFKFENTCSSAYKDSTSINENNIYISLEDTSRWHARCICSHESYFWYHIENIDKINLILDIKFYAQDNFITCVDTLLNLD